MLLRDGKSVTIHGHVYDVQTGRPLSNARVTGGCFEFYTTDEGEYSFRTRNFEGDYFYMEAVVFPYLPVETDYINVYNKKEIIVDFYLFMDLRLDGDCAPKGVMHYRMQDELNNLK